MALASNIFAVVIALIVVDPAIGMKLINSLHDTVDSRIIGGQNAFVGQFPYQVSVRIWTSSLPAGYYYFCGGTIIHAYWVLTAAHCVKPTNNTDFEYIITAGKIKLSTTEPETSQQIRVSTTAYTHPGFLGSVATLVSGFDVAVIELDEPFDFDTNVDKICYAPHNYDVHHHADTGIISGWGLTNISNDDLPNILQWAEVDLQPDWKCFFAFLVGYDVIQYICVGEEGHTACSGDSGGPLTTEDDKISDIDVSNPNLKNKMVAGITSKGSSDCDTYTVYTRVAHFSNWIYSKTGVPPCQIVS